MLTNLLRADDALCMRQRITCTIVHPSMQHIHRRNAAVGSCAEKGIVCNMGVCPLPTSPPPPPSYHQQALSCERPAVTLCYAMLRYATLCYAMLCYATLCYAMLRYATLCYATLCYALLCYAMLCYATLRYAMLWYTFSGRSANPNAHCTACRMQYPAQVLPIMCECLWFWTFIWYRIVVLTSSRYFQVGWEWQIQWHINTLPPFQAMPGPPCILPIHQVSSYAAAF